MDKTILLPDRQKAPAKGSRDAMEQSRQALAENEQEMARRRKEIDAEEAERELADKYDLAAMYAKDPNLFPLEVALWNILIEMVRPATRYGTTGFYKTPGQLQAEEYLAKIGKVIACGPSALEGKTESGIELKYLCKGVSTAEQLIGKYIIQQPYTGTDVWFTPLPGKKLKLITATEVLAVTSNPTMFMKP